MLFTLLILAATLIVGFVVWYGAILLVNLLFQAFYLAWKTIYRLFRS